MSSGESPNSAYTGFEKFQIGGPADLPENQMQIPRSAAIGGEIKNLLDEEGAQNSAESLEQLYQARERLDWESANAKHDIEFHVLTNARRPKDLEIVTDVIKTMENFDYGGVIDPYSFRRYERQALSNWRRYSKSEKELLRLGVITGSIGEDGYLNGEIKMPGFDIAIDKFLEPKKNYRPTLTYDKDPRLNPGMTPTQEKWEVTEEMVPVEKAYFGVENDKKSERSALAYANKEILQQMIVSDKQHQETIIFDMNRAALEEQVKIFFIKQIGMSNVQFGWFFNAADITKITPEKVENKELGDRRNRAMRMERLIGHSETKEKMEKYLNETFALEMILDEATIDNVLTLAKIDMNKATGEDPRDFFNRRFEAAAKYLIGDGLKISYKNRTTKDGETVAVKQYELKGWLTQEERDINTKTYRENVDSKGNKTVNQKGADAVTYETKILKVRGFLTNDGNVFSRGEKDLQYSMNSKLSVIIGDKFAVRDADRMFWTRGEKDELGPEIYAYKYKVDKDSGKVVYDRDENGNLIPDLPTGEELVAKWNELKTDAEWIAWGRDILQRFSLPGEPIGSDLSKLFWTKLYRLKDQLNKRPTGLLASTDKIDRLSQSLFSLARTQVETAYLDKNGDVYKDVEGKVKTTKVIRSLREQWDGFKGDEHLAIELAKDMGDLDWEQVRVPQEVEEVVVAERRDSAAEWDTLKIPKAVKDALIEAEGSENKALVAAVEQFFVKDDGGVGDNADGFYKLMNFLAGDGNPEKRPWAYFTNAKIDPKSLLELDTWTGKNKFLSIIFGAAGAFGDFRKYDRKSSIELQNGKEVAARKFMRSEADERTSKAKIDWYNSIRSHPQYPAWRTMKTEYKRYTPEGKDHANGLFLHQIVEGMSKDKPGIAVRYGFMKPEEIGKSPQTQMNVLYE